jgi:DNA-binding MarR family transcriptional regulator
MKKISPAVNFFLETTKFQTKLARRLDASLNGISLNEFIILYHLQQATDHKMRRIDLADKLGLTASGITRLLLPMEKIGLVTREANSHDARVSYVVLVSGGKTKLNEGLDRIEIFSEDLISDNKKKELTTVTNFFSELNRII